MEVLLKGSVDCLGANNAADLWRVHTDLCTIANVGNGFVLGTLYGAFTTTATQQVIVVPEAAPAHAVEFLRERILLCTANGNRAWVRPLAAVCKFTIDGNNYHGEYGNAAQD